jgi:hypothetical protein
MPPKRLCSARRTRRAGIVRLVSCETPRPNSIQKHRAGNYRLMPLQVNIHPSRYFLGFILLTHMGAMLLLLALPVQWWALLLIEVCLIASFVHSVKKHIVRSNPNTIVKVWVDDQNKWFCLQRKGETLAVTLKGDSVASGWLVILNLETMVPDAKSKTKKVTVLVFPDSVTKTEYRRLKAWMNSH